MFNVKLYPSSVSDCFRLHLWSLVLDNDKQTKSQNFHSVLYKWSTALISAYAVQGSTLLLMQWMLLWQQVNGSTAREPSCAHWLKAEHKAGRYHFSSHRFDPTGNRTQLPGVAAHDSLFCCAQELPCRAVHERRITRCSKTNKGLRLATPGRSSVQIGLNFAASLLLQRVKGDLKFTGKRERISSFSC